MLAGSGKAIGRSHEDLRLTDLKHHSKASVYKKGELAASITRLANGDLSFRYDSDYLARRLPALASTLPLNAEEVITDSGSLPSFFSGLLPGASASTF